MENNITAKLKALSFSSDNVKSINKFISSLNDEFISLEEMIKIINFLGDKGIQISKPSQIKVFANGFDYIKSMIENAEKIGHLDIYRQNPVFINSKEGIKRLKYLLNINEQIRNEKGKYLSIIFSKKAFDRKFGTAYLEEPKKDVIVQNNTLEEVKKEIKIEQPNPSPVSTLTKATDNKMEIKKETPTFKVVDIISQTKEKVVDTEEELINQILSSPQSIGIDDQGIERFEVLLSNLKHVLEVVYNTSEIDEIKRDSLLKLITNGYPDNEKILYYTIVYNKNITEEEKLKIKEAIKEELSMTNIMNFDMGSIGRAA